MEVPSLKEDNGKEVRCLHDVLLQHYHAIQPVDQDNFGETLVTVFIKLKLDPTTCTMRDWQHSSREPREVPPFEDLLDFLNLQACDMKNNVRDIVKNSPTESNLGKRTTRSYTASVEDCVSCKKDNHPFRGASHSLHYRPTRKWSLSRTVVFTSIA